jgi:hypothetical protein
MGMIKIDPTIDPLATGSTTKVCYRVEARFHGEGHAPGWRRNQVEHETLEQAQRMAQHFTKLADVRIVCVEVKETVVS